MRNKRSKPKFVDGDEEFEKEQIDSANNVYNPDFETRLRDEILSNIYGVTDMQGVEIADVANKIKRTVDPDAADDEEVAEIKRLAGIRSPEI